MNEQFKCRACGEKKNHIKDASYHDISICKSCSGTDYAEHTILEDEVVRSIITKRFVVLFKGDEYEIYKHSTEDSACSQYESDYNFGDESIELAKKLSDEDSDDLDDIISGLKI